MKNATIKPTKTHARKIIELLRHGLTHGLGRQEPGKMCVEAAVCHAFGLPHSDNPPCVGEAVRAFKIKLNDCSWSSDAARADGMRKLAIAQLGSNELDQMDFGKTLYLRGVQKILPMMWEAEAKRLPKNRQKEMTDLVTEMKAVTTLDEAKKVARAASASASASAYAYAYAHAYAYASAYASASASAYTYAYAYAYAYASASAYAELKKDDALLRFTAEVGLQVLIEMKSPGCKWLPLCEEETA